jgi:hypothetical protein
MVAALEQQLKRGDKALIGNSAYRRYLRAATGGRRNRSRQARRRSPLRRHLRPAQQCTHQPVAGSAPISRPAPGGGFVPHRKGTDALMRTRPIYHSSDAAIRGHVFCSFLALVLRKELDERCRMAGQRPEWADVLRELDRLQEIELNKDGRQVIMRTPATGIIGPLFEAARIALPANIREPASSAMKSMVGCTELAQRSSDPV